MTDPDVAVVEPQDSSPDVIDTAGGRIPRAKDARSLTHGGITGGQLLSIHIMAAGFPLLAGLAFYGWRALLTVIVALGAAAAAIACWRRVGRRGGQIDYAHGLWLALLLSLTLPPHLWSDAVQIDDRVIVAWPLVPASAILLIIVTWISGGISSGRVHPVVATYLVVAAISAELLVPVLSLQRSHAFIGDLLKAGDIQEVQPIKGAWIEATQIPGQDAVHSEAASQLLTTYTSGIERPPGSFLTLEALVRDHMPPLEDLIVGGTPGPIGTSSAIALIVGGMFLLYRGMIDYRIPLLIFVSALLSLLILPVPAVIRETAREWHWIVMRHSDVSPAVATTFANYELIASPLLFVAFFLATDPGIRPMTHRGRTIYAVLIGLLAAVLQLYFSVRVGPYLALLVVGLLSPLLDRWFVPRTLV